MLKLILILATCIMAMDIDKLQSNPGSENLIYLNFTGGGGYQNSTIQPYSDVAGITRIYEAAIEDFYIFDVNITTDQAVYDAHPVNKRVNILIGFGASGYMLGLGNWSPLLGLDYSINTGVNVSTRITHWYNGSLDNRHTQQQDIEMIGDKLGYVSDDYLGLVPLRIEPNGEVLSSKNKGGIQSQTDTDVFTFDTQGGAVEFTVKPNDIHYPNLVSQAVIRNSNGDTVAVGAPAGELEMDSYVTAVLTAGSYTMEIDGVGIPNVINDYSSYGPYTIEGTISNSNIIEVVDVNILEVIDQEKCASNYTPQLKINNDGSVPIENISYSVSLDNTVEDSGTLSVTLNPGESQVISLNSISFSGQYDMKVSLSAVSTTPEKTPANNEVETKVRLQPGIAHKLELKSFYNSPTFAWDITLPDDLNQIVNSDMAPMTNISGDLYESEDICLPQNCYEMNVTGLFESSGTCAGIPDLQPGKTYVGGDRVLTGPSDNRRAYEAKYWTQSTPPGTEWTDLGICESNDPADYFRLVDGDLGDQLFNVTAANNTQLGNLTFCVGQQTTVLEGNSIQPKVNFVNLGNTIMVEASTFIKSYQIFNGQGQLVQQENQLMTRQVKVELSSIAQTYFLEVQLENNHTESYHIHPRGN